MGVRQEGELRAAERIHSVKLQEQGSKRQEGELRMGLAEGLVA